jgi:hypothetical protein
MSGSSQKPKARSHIAKLSILALLALLFGACEMDPVQWVCHPAVEERVAENLSGTLPVPQPVAVDPDSFVFGVFGDPQLHADLANRLAEFGVYARAYGLDFFCALGDLAHDASEAEVAAAKAAFDSVGVPYYVTIGNHDLYQREGWQRYKSTWGRSTYSVTIGGRLKLIFLDTADGMLGETQFEWLEEQLADTLPRHKIVGTHFPIYSGERPLWGRLARAAERYRLLSLLHEHGVEAWCSGHIHAWRYDRIEDLDHFVVGTMPASIEYFDYGVPGYLQFSLVRDTLRWQRIEFE